jgi:outer membrane beta-barrel protein
MAAAAAACTGFVASPVFAQTDVPEPGGTPAAETKDSKEPREDAQEGEETKDAAAERREEKKKALADRIKAVQRKTFLKKKRVEVFPYFGLDLNDPFFQHFLVGGSVAYHVADSLAIEARGGGVFASLEQGAVKLVRVQEGAICEETCPEFKYHADVDVSWAPLYGKISLLGDTILHFDTYLTAGPGIFGTDAGLAPAVNIGIGQRYFLTDWLVVRIEVRNYVFIESRDNISDVQNLMVLGFSVSGFFPTSFEYEFQ